MQLEELLSGLSYEDLKWLVPVLGGLIIIVGGLLIGLLRGLNSGLLVTLFFGGLLCLSPVLLNALERRPSGASVTAVEAARANAALATLNNDMIRDLTRVVNSSRIALEGLVPVLEANEADTDAVDRFKQSLTSAADRLSVISDNMAEGQVLIRKLEAGVQAMDKDVHAVVPASR